MPESYTFEEVNEYTLQTLTLHDHYGFPARIMDGVVQRAVMCWDLWVHTEVGPFFVFCLAVWGNFQHSHSGAFCSVTSWVIYQTALRAFLVFWDETQRIYELHVPWLKRYSFPCTPPPPQSVLQTSSQVSHLH